MKLNNSQYDAIMRMYDAKQSHARAVQNLRCEEINARLPEYDTLRKESAEVSAEAARAAVMGDMTKRARLADKLASINEEKQLLLAAAGYPEDYLDLHYECPACKDAGFIDGKKCSCFKQAAIDLLYNQSNIKKILLLENFSNFNYDWYSEDYVDPVSGISALENIINVTKDVNAFISDFPSGQNLLFYGDTGVGKTFLTHCIASELLGRGHSVLYLSAIDLFDLFSKYTG